MVLSEILIWIMNFSSNLITSFGYLGVFLVGILGSVTVVLPIPSYAVVFLAASTLNPFLIGILAGLGAAIGELVAYGIGRSGRKIAVKNKKWDKKLIDIELLFQKYSGFLVIVFVAATPLPDNVVGIFCGMIEYPVKKYFVASLTGKIIFHWIIAYTGYYSLNFLFTVMGIPA